MPKMKSSPKISVLTPTIRPQYLRVTEETLARQTFRDFEWLVREGNPDDGFTLPADYNDMIRNSKGEIIVSLQDCIDVPEDFLEKVSKMDFDMRAYTFPVGKRLTRKDGVQAVAWDWRAFRSGEVNERSWEIDLAACHRDLFYDIGGFDESYSAGWSYDNVEVGIRAYAAGWRFFCVPELRGEAIDHDKEVPHPFRETRPSNAFRVSITEDMARQGLYKLQHL